MPTMVMGVPVSPGNSRGSKIPGMTKKQNTKIACAKQSPAVFVANVVTVRMHGIVKDMKVKRAKKRNKKRGSK